MFNIKINCKKIHSYKKEGLKSQLWLWYQSDIILLYIKHLYLILFVLEVATGFPLLFLFSPDLSQHVPCHVPVFCGQCPHQDSVSQCHDSNNNEWPVSISSQPHLRLRPVTAASVPAYRCARSQRRCLCPKSTQAPRSKGHSKSVKNQSSLKGLVAVDQSKPSSAWLQLPCIYTQPTSYPEVSLMDPCVPSVPVSFQNILEYHYEEFDNHLKSLWAWLFTRRENS